MTTKATITDSTKSIPSQSRHVFLPPMSVSTTGGRGGVSVSWLVGWLVGWLVDWLVS